MHVLAYSDHGRQTATSDAVQRIQAEHIVPRRVALFDLQLAFQRVHQKRPALNIAGGSVADADRIASDRV